MSAKKPGQVRLTVAILEEQMDWVDSTRESVGLTRSALIQLFIRWYGGRLRRRLEQFQDTVGDDARMGRAQ